MKIKIMFFWLVNST